MSPSGNRLQNMYECSLAAAIVRKGLYTITLAQTKYFANGGNCLRN